MKATETEIERLLASHGIASLGTGGGDSAEAARGGRIAELRIERRDDTESILTVTIGSHFVESRPPHDDAEAQSIIASLRSQGAIPDDASFEHMLADLLIKAAKMFEDCEATSLEFRPLHLHPASYHIGKATLIHGKALKTKARLQPDSHDRHAVFDHRHGDSTKFPR
jgi:hypothetical protein